MKYLLIFLLVMVIFIVSVTLGAQNDQVVIFNYLLAKGEYRVSTLLAVLFGCGLFLGWSVCGLFYLRLRLQLIITRRKLKQLRQSSPPLEKRFLQSQTVAVKE